MKAFMKKDSVHAVIGAVAMFVFVYCAGYYGLR